MTAQRKPSIATRVGAGLRGYDSVGKSVRSVKIEPDGTVTFLTGPPASEADRKDGQAEEWAAALAADK